MIPSFYPLLGLAACCCTLAVILLAPASKAFRKAWFAIAAFVLTLYAGTKPPQPTHLWRFEFQNGVHDIGSYCTNDTIHAEWNYEPAFWPYTLKAKYRDLTITNEVGVCIDVWHNLEDVPVAAMSADWFVPDATNMSVICYAEYVPPPHVVTNGVYHMEGVSRSMSTTNSPAPDFVTWGTRVELVLPNGATMVITPTNRPPDPILLNQNPPDPDD